MSFVSMKHIYRSFGEVRANIDANLDVEHGEIHALLGENGAGKSTLMNILYGLYGPDSGTIEINGKEVHIATPRDAIDLGIGMVHQHFMLVEAHSVIENVVLGMKGNHAVLRLKDAAKRFEALSRQFGMEIDPWAKIEELTIGQRQRVEILKALYRDAKLLILDEPTAVLTPQESRSLFATMRKLANEGLTIILISHKLNEIMESCDRCTVLRQGETVKTVRIPEIQDKAELAALMIGRDISLETEKSPMRAGEVVLKVEGIGYRSRHGYSKLEDMHFQIHSGEILGICGVDGNGQSQLVRCLTGLLKPSTGTFYIDGRDCTRLKPREILQQGVSHIPEDRFGMAYIREMTVSENLMLINYRSPEYSGRGGFLKRAQIARNSRKLVEENNIKTSGIYAPGGTLSGGNQQKVVVAREMDREPRLLIAMHPDRGLDVGATKFIQQQIIAARDNGAAVLLVSTEIEEIMDISDRIMVMFSGRNMGILDQKDATIDKLALMMTGTKLEDIPADTAPAAVPAEAEAVPEQDAAVPAEAEAVPGQDAAAEETEAAPEPAAVSAEAEAVPEPEEEREAAAAAAEAGKGSDTDEITPQAGGAKDE